MKNILAFWGKRSSYEKAVLGLSAAFVLFCLTYFIGKLYYESRCAACRQILENGAHYILDVRTGEMLCLSDYVNQESSSWISPVSHSPQEVSTERRVGYMRFPRQAARTARYCSRHTSGLDTDFLILSPTGVITICRAVLDGQTLVPDGRIITKRLNKSLDCWELEIEWDRTPPPA